VHSGEKGDKMLIKTGVDISRLNREIRRALPKIEKIYNVGKKELVITSTYEGNHSAGSLHYANDAIDIRRWPVDNNILDELLHDALGKDFDIVHERDHIHIEHDPK